MAEQTARLRAVAELARTLAGAPTPSQLARAAAAAARRALDGVYAAVRVAGERAAPGVGLPAEVLGEDGEPTDGTPPAGYRLAVPLTADGTTWGELSVQRAPGRAPLGPAELELAEMLAAVTAAGLELSARLAETRRLAFTDPLTSLANRRAVERALDAALARHRREGVVVSLVVCDLNGLKRVNDVHGHTAGDRLLQRFGRTLAECAATLPDALAARLGGDEFCLLATGPSPDEVVRAAEELCRRAARLHLGEGAACGVASTGHPIGPVRSAGRLFRLADAAQYRAKAERAGGPVVAGRLGGVDDPVVRLADAPIPGRDRRRLRGRRSEGR